MTRINVVAEGQSELRFVKQCLNRYFGGTPLADARCILTSTERKTNYEYRGGLSTYQHAKSDIIKWLKEDRQAYVSTMFDFFRLPSDFPEYQTAMRQKGHQESVQLLEAALLADIERELPQYDVAKRFIPYIQLHEFESLLFCDLNVLKYDYLEPDEVANIDKLQEETKRIPPEEINHGPDTAPSKRLLNILPYQKGDAPAEWIDVITIGKIREKCPHFSAWIEKLQSLPAL